MSDQEQRELERRYRETGDVEAAAALIQARLREGTLERSRVQWAAALGYPPARQLEPGEVPGLRVDLAQEGSTHSAFKACAARAELEKSERILIACAFAEQALPAWESQHPDHHLLRAGIETARRAAGQGVPEGEEQRALSAASHVQSRYEKNCEGVGTAVQACFGRGDLLRAARAAEVAWSRVSPPDPETGAYKVLGGKFADEAKAFQHELLAKVLCGLEEPAGPSPGGIPRRDAALLLAEREWRRAPTEASAVAYLVARTERGLLAFDLLVAAALSGYRPARLAAEACRARCSPFGSARERPPYTPPIEEPERLLGLIEAPEIQRAIRVWSCECVAHLVRSRPKARSLEPMIELLRDVAQGTAAPGTLEQARARLAAWHQEAFHGRTHLLHHGGEKDVGWVFLAAEALTLPAWGLARRLTLQAMRMIQLDRLRSDPNQMSAAAGFADKVAEAQLRALCEVLGDRSTAPRPAFSDLSKRDYARLRVTSGPSKGQRLVLHPGRPYGLGRGRTVDLHFTEGTKISRFHATVDWRAGSWYARDANSTHGLFLNGEAIRSSRLRGGDLLQLGEATVLFEPPTAVIHLDSPTPKEDRAP